MNHAHSPRSVGVVIAWLLLSGLAVASVLAAAAINGTYLPAPVIAGELLIAAGALVVGIAIRAGSRGGTMMLLLWSACTVAFLVLFAPLVTVSAPLPLGALRYVLPTLLVAAILTGMVAIYGAFTLPRAEP